LGLDIHRSELNEAKVAEFKGLNPRFNALSRRQTLGSEPSHLMRVRCAVAVVETQMKKGFDIHEFNHHMELALAGF